MKPYGADRRDITDNPAIRKGDYNRYGHSKTHRASYKVVERALKKRSRREDKNIQYEDA